MDDDLSDLRNRQTRTERRVAHLETKVDQEARLRADMDEELGSISAAVNAHTQSLNALREDQAAQGQQLDHIVTKIDNTEFWMGHLNGRMDLLENKVTGLDGRMDGVETRLDGVDTRLGGIETGLAGVKAGVDEILSRLGKG